MSDLKRGMSEFRILYGAYMTGRGKMATPECDNVLFSDTKILFMSEELTKQGYALVKLEGAEERVMAAVEKCFTDFTGKDMSALSPNMAQAAIRALTESE